MNRNKRLSKHKLPEIAEARLVGPVIYLVPVGEGSE